MTRYLCPKKARVSGRLSAVTELPKIAKEATKRGSDKILEKIRSDLKVREILFPKEISTSKSVCAKTDPARTLLTPIAF